jgi:hypothetical protein
MCKRDKTPGEIAEIIEHFIYRNPSDEQLRRDVEWNDLLDCGVSDPELASIVKQCERINVEFIPDSSLSAAAQQQRELNADQQLMQIAVQLRELEKTQRGK